MWVAEDECCKTHGFNADRSLQLLNAEAENEITVCAFRLLTMDLLILYGVMNEGTINVLGMFCLTSHISMANGVM